MRRKKRTNEDWTRIECLRLTNTRRVWTQEMHASQMGGQADSATAMVLHPLEKGPQGEVEPEMRDKLGPICEVTDYAAGIKRRRREIRRKSNLVRQEDKLIMQAANADATRSETEIGEEELRRKARLLTLAANNPDSAASSSVNCPRDRFPKIRRPFERAATAGLIRKWAGGEIGDVGQFEPAELASINEYCGLDIIDAGDVEVTTHPSHKLLVYCGGYVGCLHCGRVGSTHTGQSKAIRTEDCSTPYIQKFKKGERRTARLGGKHGAGSLRPAQKLLQGTLPHSTKSWPNGETNPVPRKVVVRQTVDAPADLVPSIREGTRQSIQVRKTITKRHAFFGNYRRIVRARVARSQARTLHSRPESASLSGVEIALRDRREAERLNGDRAWEVASSPPIMQWRGRYEAPRDSQGRLQGSGYESSDHELDQSPEEEENSEVGNSATSVAILESLSDRVAKRRRRDSADQLEAEELNRLS